MGDWWRQFLCALSSPDGVAALIGSAFVAGATVLAAYKFLGRQLEHDRAGRREDRNTAIVAPLARTLRNDAREFRRLIGDISYLQSELKFVGFSQVVPGRRSRSYPGQASVMEAVDAAKPALPSPESVLRLVVSRQDRWIVMHWLHLVRRSEFGERGTYPILDGQAELFEGLDLYGLIDGAPCPGLLYQAALPEVAQRVFQTSIDDEEKLGLDLYDWNGGDAPIGMKEMVEVPAAPQGPDLRNLVEEIAKIFTEEEARVRSS